MKITFAILTLLFTFLATAQEVTPECEKKINDGVYSRLKDVMNRAAELYGYSEPQFSEPMFDIMAIDNTETGRRYEVAFSVKMNWTNKSNDTKEETKRSVQASFGSDCTTLGDYKIFRMKDLQQESK